MKTTNREKARQRRKSMKNSSFSRSNCPLIKKQCRADKYESNDLKWTEKIPECPVYHPSKEEFEDPLTYLQKISPEASKCGICKIVSPLKASISADEVLKDFKFSTYVQPLRLAKWDRNDKVVFLMGERNYNYTTFKSMAEKAFNHRVPDTEFHSPQQLEKEFWHQMATDQVETVEYAVNVDGSAFSTDPEDELSRSRWNLKALPRLPNSVLHMVEHEIPGITYPMLYIGMLFSMFAWHVEDHYLYSMNYHHVGAPKTWYGVPGIAALQFEKVVLNHVYAHDILSLDGEDGAFIEIAKKTTMFPPSMLLQHSVPVFKAVQMPGEFVITFPRAYHAGFSNGFSCGEAVNFALNDWFPFGALASRRYANLGLMAILPHEELLCKVAVRLLKHEVSEGSFVGLASHNSVRISFLQHMQFLNKALRHLKNNVENLRASSMLLPISHGTTICGACFRDCYLTFLECNSCHRLLCLLHEIKSLDCRCGGEVILFAREEMWDAKDIAQKLEEDAVLQEVQQEAKSSNNFCPQPDILSCTIHESIPCNKNNEPTDSIERVVKIRGKDGDDFDAKKPNKGGCHGKRGLFAFYRASERARTRCYSSKDRSKDQRQLCI